jgi:DNA-binding transcriptional regulator YdaS (Cro superfamily)
MNSVEKAVEAAGGKGFLAKRFEISRQSIEKWIRQERIPVERVLAIEEMSGISRYELRPDIYPRDAA